MTAVTTERYVSIDLAASQEPVETALGELNRANAVERLWRRDPTLWKPRPEDDVELSNRVGWLTLPRDFLQRLNEIDAHRDRMARDGITRVVVCGMGGSSLAPEVFRITFGQAHGSPALLVLDSTDPGAVHLVDQQIDPRKTIFLISSKSGGTVEVMSFLAHFWSLAGQESRAHFFAITDPGTSLERLARERQFGATFLNPTEIGGRYSALSFFGLVPAVLSGVDTRRLLEQAAREQDLCGADQPAEQNPGAWLGAYMGGLARAGRDKLTLLTSPGLQSFGLWVEQLIAESTGKEGKGIVPVVGEPIGAVDAYGNDRAFVVLRLEGDDNSGLDPAVDALRGTHPVVVRSLSNRYELGAEMYCWEVATALAGKLLGINPFDQPNVQESKDNTARVLKSGETAPPEGVVLEPGALERFLAQAGPGDYVGLQAYLTPTPESERQLQRLRAGIRDRYRVATTLGYGPRFLHSTGQLHKGGAPRGMFLQFTYTPDQDIEIPGQPYTFGSLFAAQALGDLQSLQERGLRVGRVELGSDAVGRLGGLSVA